MKKLIIFLIAAIISECSGEPFNAIDLAIDEICIVKSTHTGLPRISEKDSIKLIDRPEIIERHIRKISENGKDYYQILNKTTLINNQTYENTSFIEIGETLKEISLDFVRKGPDGKEIEKKYYR